jgi:choline dehydrogenase-like flavoprotein
MDKMEKQNLCVIGAGPAGIILVLEYLKLNPSKKVVLVEYGDGRVKNKLDDTIINKNEVNHHEPYECTNKGLGGSSATWGGRCVMYDEVDFEDRPILKGGCTWDKTLFDEVNSYLKLTVPYFECGEDLFSLHEMEAFRDKRIADGFEEGDVTDSVVERWSMPTRFGDRYRKELLSAENLTILEGYEAREFDKTYGSNKIEKLIVKNITSGKEIIIESDFFAICAGTQESTRILLRNTTIFNTKPAALGRYYQGHLSGKIASVKFFGNPRMTDYGFLKDDDIYIRRRFQFTKEYLVVRQSTLL